MGLPFWLDARIEPPADVAALDLPPLPLAAQLDGLVLLCDAQGLALELRVGKTKTRLVIDFLAGALQYRAKIHQARSEMLVRACGVPNDGTGWHVVDATAGLGRDAFLLATCGAEVTLLERNPVLALLLANALRQALVIDASAIVKNGALSRLHLLHQDAVLYLRGLADGVRPDVVYCDPMFPPRKKSAAVSGDMQILHLLVGQALDASDLLAAALRVAVRRVVVKRPLRAPALLATGLEHIRPAYVLAGRSSRFDIYLIETLPL